MLHSCTFYNRIRFQNPIIDSRFIPNPGVGNLFWGVVFSREVVVIFFAISGDETRLKIRCKKGKRTKGKRAKHNKLTYPKFIQTQFRCSVHVCVYWERCPDRDALFAEQGSQLSCNLQLKAKQHKVCHRWRPSQESQRCTNV